MKSKQKSKMSNQAQVSPFVPYILERGKLGDLIGSTNNDTASLLDPVHVKDFEIPLQVKIKARAERKHHDPLSHTTEMNLRKTRMNARFKI
jgi:hypothetical protein